MMTVCPARAGAPVPSMTRTFVNATTGASTLMKARTASLNCVGVCGETTAAAANSMTKIKPERVRIGILPARILPSRLYPAGRFALRHRAWM
jgi:hypothetical protein